MAPIHKNETQIKNQYTIPPKALDSLPGNTMMNIKLL